MSNRTERAGAAYSVLESFRYEIRRFLNFSERAAREASIEPQQHQALLLIKAKAPGTGPRSAFWPSGFKCNTTARLNSATAWKKED